MFYAERVNVNAHQPFFSVASDMQSDQVAPQILQALEHGDIADTRTLHLEGVPAEEVASFAGQSALKGALLSLEVREMVNYETHSPELSVLSEEGQTIVANGSPEFRVWQILAEPKGIPEIEAALGKDVAKIGQGKAMRNKWVKKVPEGFTRAVDSVDDETRAQLADISSVDPKALADLKKRKLVTTSKKLFFTVKKGPKYSPVLEKPETDLTVELLASGKWKSSTFKEFNFASTGNAPAAGALHPLMKVREEFRNIFFEMGFSEMPTDRYVETGFWNFDGLFVPQQHPARELQDTFYVKDPSESVYKREGYAGRVADAHEGKGVNSLGYGYDFSLADTSKLVLRTHTTGVTCNVLHDLAHEEGGFKPAKRFSIDRVFRNEAVDATHLAEFNQVEGCVIDYDLTLGDLIGFMQAFFSKMGIDKLRFKPAYNPYTEPSLEVFSWHEGLKKWVEIGNSGVFRREMLEPMGFPSNVRALGWGISLERPTMIRYGISNIRDLVGHKVPLDLIENSPAVRF